ncbi:MAG: HAMP domain-containing histidine kinase [Candidatus Thorarchaeota archaeon]|nr:HAMP domain-containing histidine kinase [Candidatus Thorarchaeota archaeon]
MNDNIQNTEDQLRNLQGIAHQVVVLRNVSRLFSNPEDNLNSVLFKLVHMIPEAFQFPNLIGVQVAINDQSVTTDNFSTTPWSISADIISHGTSIGKIQVVYVERPSETKGDPFKKGEKDFLETIGKELGIFIERTKLWRVQDQQRHELEIYASLLRHDLRNDLGVILGYVDMVKLTAHDPQIIETVTAIEAASQRMLNILSAFGKMPTTTEPNITKILETSISQARAAEPKMTIDLQIDPAVKEKEIPKSRLLPMVFDNLLRNASTHAGIEATVTITVGLEGDYVRIVVADDGPGVADTIKDSLFEKGVSTRGGGLGLYLSREIVKSIGGSIRLLDTEKGAAFEVMLPIVSVL